jgi:hypothetical protein
MRGIRLAELRDLVAWERVREAERARVMELKRARRIQLGDSLSLLFENRDTVLLQIQEMVRTERIVDPVRIQEEIDAYSPLLPGRGELSATLFIEIPDLHRMSQEQVRVAVNRFQGLDQQRVWLDAGEHALPARFEGGHSKEEKMAAVHYLRFAVPAAARAALVVPETRARLRVDHPRYATEAPLGPATRAALLADLE